MTDAYKHPTPQPGIASIKPYVAGKAASTKSAKPVIKLSSNENPYGPSPKAVAAFDAVRTQLHRYPDSGHGAFRQAVASIYPAKAENIICGAGSDELIGMLIHAYAGPGDEVLFSEHAFLMYRIYTLSHGATPVAAPEKNLTVDIDALLAHVTKNTKLVFLANPNNPTGTYLPFHEVQRLRNALPEEVILVLDAAYAEYMDAVSDYDTGHALAQTSNTVITHTLSKIYGLPALRLGFAHAPAHIIDTLGRIKSPFNVNAAALSAGIAALHDQAYIKDMISKNAAERSRVTKAVEAFGYTVIASYTNFILVHVGSEAQADALHSHLEQEAIIVRDVKAYQLPEYLRISLGTPKENDALLHAITAFARQSPAQKHAS